MTGTRAIETILGQMSLDEKLRLCTGDGLWHTAAFPSLGVPAVLMSDGTSGVRLQKESKGPDDTDFAYNAINSSFDSDEALTCTYAATCFPSGSTISCSWDTELIQEVGRAIAEECRALGIRLLLGPGINIRRHPLTARNFEYYSEDPFLTGRMGAAMVKGLAERGWVRSSNTLPAITATVTEPGLMRSVTVVRSTRYTLPPLSILSRRRTLSG